MNTITIELTNVKPITATISDDDVFSINNALLTKVPFLTFADSKTGDKWTVRTDYIITVNVAGGK